MDSRGASSGRRFGALLHYHRQARAVTQQTLAERAGLGVETISALERGVNQRPHHETVMRLAQALGLAPQEETALILAAQRTRGAPACTPHAGNTHPPLAGRTEELALQERHLAGEGPPVLLFAGEPGMGKTRLLQEAARLAAGQGWCVLQGGCRRGGQDPYAPLVEAMTEHLRVRRAEQARADLAGCAWLVRLAPELAGGLIEPLPPWTLPPEHERRLMVAALRRFLANVAGPAGTVLLLDDLQWAGTDALDVLVALGRAALSSVAAGEAPLRIVGAYRHTEAPVQGALAVTLADLAHAGLVRRRRLEPLAMGEAAALLAALLPAEGETAPHVREQVLRRADGVPFYLVSYAQGLRAGGTAGQDGSVPWDVAQGVQQRVAALPLGGQALLGLAAVIGRVAPRALLTALAGQPESDVAAALRAACHAGLLRETGEHAYQFAHDVIREVVEAELGAAERVMQHRRVAEALEQHPATSPVEEIAYHYAQTGEHHKAAEWLERAGDRATAAFANTAALADYEAARAHVEAGGHDAAAHSRLDEKLGDLCSLVGEYSRAQEAFTRARERETTPLRRAELWHKEGLTYRWRTEAGLALAAFAAAEAEGGEEGAARALPSLLRATVELSRCEVYHMQWDLGAMEEAARRALELLDGAGTAPAVQAACARAHQQLSVAAGLRGNLARAEAHFQDAVALQQAEGDQSGLAQSWWTLGALAFDRGALELAEEHCRRSLELSERIGQTLHSGICRQTLADVARSRGDLARAEDCSRRGLALAERVGHQAGQGWGWHNLGAVALLRGDLPRAEECHRRSLAIDERLAAHSGGTWIGLGLVACERGDLATAAHYCRTEGRVARRLGLALRAAEAVLGQARACLRGGRCRAARRLLAYGRAVAARDGWAQPRISALLLAAELELHCTAGQAAAHARQAAEEALQVATEEGRRLDAAIARRLLGQCALAAGDGGAAEAQLCAALVEQEEIGAALEAARTRLALAETLMAGTEAGTRSTEAQGLLAEARAQFAASGAALDLDLAEQVAARWETQASAKAETDLVGEPTRAHGGLVRHTPSL